MGVGFAEGDKRVPNPNDLINLQQSQYLMEGRGSSSAYYTHQFHETKNSRSLSLSLSPSQGTARRFWPAATYLGLLLCLAASLLILPLILPPLPPPPLMLLLLLPVAILAMLMVLAFMPSNETNHMTTHTYM